MTVTPTSTRPAPSPTSSARVAGGIAAAAVLGIAAVAVVAQAALALGADPGFDPLRPASYVPATLIGTLAGAAGWHGVRRFAARPAATMRWLVPVVVVLSLVPNALMFLGGPPGATPVGIVALMVMHVVVAAVAVGVFSRTAALPTRTG